MSAFNRWWSSKHMLADSRLKELEREAWCATLRKDEFEHVVGCEGVCIDTHCVGCMLAENSKYESRITLLEGEAQAMTLKYELMKNAAICNSIDASAKSDEWCDWRNAECNSFVRYYKSACGIVKQACQKGNYCPNCGKKIRVQDNLRKPT